MARDLNPKCKLCRRAGEKLFLKGERCFGAKCALTKRNYPPGIHGNKFRQRLTDYGIHLKEKQKVKRIYGILEKQLRKYFTEATKSKTETGLKLIELLERRMDNVVYRAGLAVSKQQARQMVSHGLFKINNKKIDVPSCLVKVNDIISIKKDRSLEQGVLAENIKKIKKTQDSPAWLIWNEKEKTIKIVSLPEKKDLTTSIDTRLIVEFYSK
ncbi:30S ribosomal protein S4 [Patescibacteria group bacterium]